MTDSHKTLWQYLATSHGLILLTYTSGFAVLALVTALIVSYVGAREAEKVLLDEGRGFVQLAAQSAVVPLLTGSEENSNDFLSPLLAYQNVYHITVYDREFKLFFNTGKEPKWMPTINDLSKISEASLIHEDQKYWYFLSPVWTEGNDSERIGNVFTILTKETINVLGKNILTYTLWICGIAASVLWIMLYFVLRRVTLPIRKIAGLMDITKGITQRYPIPKHIPSDVKIIYNSFNTMLGQIETRDKALNDHVSNMENTILDKTRDLTDKNMQLEEAHNKAIAAAHAKDIFVANVSHELRTPIQAIMGNCELLGDKYRDKELAKIIISAYQLLNLVNNILDLSKIENGKIEINTKTISVHRLINGIVEADMPVIKANKNSFEVEIDNKVNLITTDRELITQVINNLLSNAGRYTSEGHIKLHVRQENIQGEYYIYFDVIDDGIGIPEEKIDKIFQPFEQADMSKTRLYGGTGLGLTISKKLATLLGGRLTVESKLGRGSTFSLCVPEGTTVNDIQQKDRISIKLSPRKILLAEDHPFISDAVKQLLESDGHTVTVTSDGIQTIAKLNQELFDIALIDVHMPELDGIEVINMFQASKPHSHTKIFLLTADATMALRQQAEKLGAKIIQKPFSRAQLVKYLVEE